jgi:hypothetical protein
MLLLALLKTLSCVTNVLLFSHSLHQEEAGKLPGGTVNRFHLIRSDDVL